MSRDRSPLRTLHSRIAGITLALLIIFTGVPLSDSALARQADSNGRRNRTSRNAVRRSN